MQQTSPAWKWLWNEGGKNLPPSEYEGDIAAFDNPGYTYPKNITVGIEPVQSGSGVPSPTNVRPISGWTGANVWDDPKYGGLIEWNQLYTKPNGTAISNGITFTISNGRISVSGVNNGSGTSYCVFYFINQPPANHVILFGGVPGTGSATTYDITLTNTAGNTAAYTGWLIAKKSGKYQMLNIDIRKNYDADTKPLVFVPQAFDLTQMFGATIADYIYSLEQSTAGAGMAWFKNLFPKDYYPYNEGEETCVSAVNGDEYRHIPITFPSEAGTVYGGTLDVTTGLLTVERVMDEFDGSSDEGWYKFGASSASAFAMFVPREHFHESSNEHIKANYLNTISQPVTWGDYDNWISANSSNGFVTGIKSITDVDSWKAYLSQNPLQICYELATPQTYQLSPTEVTLLMGDNNIWADTGDTSVALESPGHMRLEARATVGGTVYSDISAPVVNRALMQDRLSVGNVVSASLALAVRGAANIPRSAAVVIEARLNDGQTASEWLPQGTFYISRRARDPVTGLLALECYDALLKANAVWVPSAGAWPRTLAAVTAELAALLGVTLDSRTVIPTGAAYAMSEPDEGTAIRDALSLVAQAAGGNWIITPAGKLRLVRLGEAGDTVDVAGVVGGIDVGQAGTITGVRSTVDGVATLTGDDTGIVVDVALAPVIAVELAEALIGQAWQPFRLDGAVYDPAAELGDAVRAGANGEVASALCSEQAAYGPAFRGSIAAPDPGEVTDEYPYLGSAERTLALAKAAANRAVERYDDNLTQQEIFNRLTDNGAAQGLVLYDGQLYINAGYVNAGRMNVGRIDFNEPESYYDVPDENDPDSLLSGQTVADGWIVNTSGSGNITVFSCGFAIPLRGKTVTVTFAFNGNLNGGENTWTSISDNAFETVNIQDWLVPSSGTPSNPYTYSVVVPDDAMSFRIAMECAGVKQIEVSLDSPVTPSESIVYNYEGQRFGEGNTFFQLYRDGILITTGKSMFNGATRISRLYLNRPLDVEYGGTGAYNAAGARANLEITPANIGALASTGIVYEDYSVVLPAFSDATVGTLISSLNATQSISKSGYTPIGLTVTNYPTSLFNVMVLLAGTNAIIRCYAASNSSAGETSTINFRVIYKN